MRVMMISKALVVGAYHRKNEELSRLGIDLHVVIPHRWGLLQPEVLGGAGYTIHPLRCLFHGRNHFHAYAGLGKLMNRVKSDLLHIDEESYSFVTFQALRHAVRRSIPSLFFNWQNIRKRYPYPFSAFEHYAFRHAKAAIAGNDEARKVLTEKGCKIPIHVIPQFGVDERLFKREDAARLKKDLFDAGNPWVVGYAGRFVEEKGLLILLDAFAGLPTSAHLLLIGGGPLLLELKRATKKHNLEARVKILDHIRSSEIPRFLNCMDCLVLPSLTRPNWKEQFGRILIEAMACEVPVVGSSSGEIPRVIGEAGIVFPEGDVLRLREVLRLLMEDKTRHSRLARLGRRRVMENFTHARIARDTFAVYQSVFASIR